MLDRIMQVSKRYHGIAGDGRGASVRYTHEIPQIKDRAAINEGFAATHRAIDSIEANLDPNVYPYFQATAMRTGDAIRDLRTEGPIIGITTSELDPAWVLHCLDSNPQELAEVAGLLVAARGLAQRVHKIEFNVGREID